MAKELVQNADDEESDYIIFDFREDGLYVKNGSIFNDEDFVNIINIASRGKIENARKTGAFGIGFISVYQITDRPELQSAGKRFIFIPEERSVDELESPIKDNTEFYLPWAFDLHSIVRKELKRPAIEKTNVKTYKEELVSAAPDILLFLRTLTKLVITEEGANRIEFVREDNNPPIRQVTKVNKEKSTVVRKWFVYEDLFESPEAVELNKKPIIGIAFPLFPVSTEDDGVLYNFLPTGLYTGFKFHINGDFFPTSDRKNVVTEGDIPKVNWNSKVFSEIGSLLIRCVLDLKQKLSVEDLYQFFPPYNFNNKNLPLLDTIANNFYTSAKQSQIIPNNQNEWDFPEKIYLLNISDDKVRLTIESIGIPIVNTNLRSYWTTLQAGLGVKTLDISTMSSYILQIGIKSGTLITNAPIPFNSPDSLIDILSFVQGRLSSTGEEKQLDDFRQLPICPNREGSLLPFSELKMITSSTENIIPKLESLKLIDADLQSKSKDILSNLCLEYTWMDLIDLFSGKSAQEIAQIDNTNGINLMDLYDYLADHEQSILQNDEYCEKLKNSCIFMTNKQFKPLRGLSLKGNYKDPIGLDIILDETILTHKAIGLLTKLGIKPLDFRTYVIKYAPDYFRDGFQRSTQDKRLELTEEIRRHYSLISDDKEVCNIIKTFEMIPCNDGEYHAPTKIYITSDLLDLVLPDQYLSLNIQKVESNLEDWNGWLSLLDVTDKPKSEDVIDRTRELAAEYSSENAKSLEQLFYYYCDVFAQEGFDNEQQYNQLKYIEWIPIIGDKDKYYLPSIVFLPFNRYLFYSQAKFVTFNQTAKIRGRFLSFVNIGNHIPLDLIVKHLHWLVSQNKPPDNNIYRVLNLQFDEIPEDSKTILRNSKCVFIEEKGYFEAEHCFWGNHPFGDYRQKITDQIKDYYKLFKGIGVREDPELNDYLDVLNDISKIFGNSNRPVDDTTRDIINSIYSYLSMHASEISKEKFDEFRTKKVILDNSRLLRLPGQMFFEDKGIKADIFRDKLQKEMITKESDTWQFLEQLGVRHLSKAIVPIDFQPSVDRRPSENDVDLLRNRKSGIVTIIETQKKDFTDGWDLVTLNNLEIYEASNLSVKYAIQMDGGYLQSDIRSESSFYNRDSNRLYISTDCTGGERTYEIARNLAEILNPLLDPCHILPVLVEVLNPSQEESEINKYLQRMGYDIVIESVPKPIVYDVPGSLIEEDESGADTTTQDEEGKDTPIEKTPDNVLVAEDGDTGSTKPTEPKGKKKRKILGLDDGTADDVYKKRKAWLQERLAMENKQQFEKASDETQINHNTTLEERENHKRLALIFYNRQIEELISRVKELETGDSPAQYSIYGTEWSGISRLIRQRDDNRCRRCGLNEEDGVSLVVHHIFPRKEGGSNWHSNLISLCRTCHAEVEDRPWLL